MWTIAKSETKCPVANDVLVCTNHLKKKKKNAREKPGVNDILL